MITVNSCTELSKLMLSPYPYLFATHSHHDELQVVHHRWTFKLDLFPSATILHCILLIYVSNIFVETI